MKFVPGMPVDVFIRTRERTLVSYLVKPLGRPERAAAFREKCSALVRGCFIPILRVTRSLPMTQTTNRFFDEVGN